MATKNEVVKKPRRSSGAAAVHPDQAAQAPVQEATTQLYLYSFATLIDVKNHVRTQMIDGQDGRLAQIAADWEALQPRMQQLQIDEAAYVGEMAIQEVPAEHAAALAAIANHELVKKTFQVQFGFGIVEIDRLIACQRTINLDYVASLRAQFAGDFGVSRLIELCLSPQRDLAPVRHLELGPGVNTFASENTDLRFLGSFVKEFLPGDVAYAEMGGIPVRALISFIGFGGSPVNAYVDLPRRRVILNNGFHRVYALRSLGVTHIPVLLQPAHNPATDLPPAFQGIPKEYVVNTARPSVMRDYFTEGLSIRIPTKKRARIVTVQVGASNHDVPV